MVSAPRGSRSRIYTHHLRGSVQRVAYLLKTLLDDYKKGKKIHDFTLIITGGHVQRRFKSRGKHYVLRSGIHNWYQSLVALDLGSTSTRPDISFAVEKLSSLTYSGYPSVIEGYSDASWINNMEDHSSTSGWVFLLGGAGNEAEWLRNLVYEIPLWPKPMSTISIRCDSVATLAKAYSQVYNGKSRHLGVRHSMIRELIMNGVISIEFVKTQLNLTDHLTKGLARDLVRKAAIEMGLKST
ncbi:hypothetical protein Tco_0209669 [Tanacetum coccineum]